MTSHTHLSLDQRVKRLDRRIAEIELSEKRQAVALDRRTCNGATMPMGRTGLRREGVARFEHPPIEVPADWPLDVTRLEIDLVGEGLIGVGFGWRTKQNGLDRYHGDGRRVTVVLADELDLLEEPVGETDSAFTPFHIHSWRIEGHLS